MHTLNSWEYNSPLIYLKNNELFPPGMEEVGGNWILSNETQLKDIVKKGKIGTFKHLDTRRDLMRLNGWRYAQLSHFVKSLPGSIREENNLLPIEKIFSSNKTRGYISAIYKMLLNSAEMETPPFIKKWEKDLGVPLEENAIGNITKATHSTATDIKMIDTNYKCLSRWYATPEKMYKYQPDRSPNCWRGCRAPGTMAHIWWSCPVAKKFWQEVIQIIEEITGKSIPYDPWICLFHSSEGGKREYNMSIIPVLLNSAKSEIPKKWQNAEGPKIRDWFLKIQETYNLEKREKDLLTKEHVIAGGRWASWVAFRKSAKYAEMMQS